MTSLIGYVDDTVLICVDVEEMEKFKVLLVKEFKIKNLRVLEILPRK